MSQTFESQYGRPSIEVSDLCPTIAIRHRLGRTHVATPAADVEAEVREAVARTRQGKHGAGWTPEAEEEAVAFALWQHAENGALYDHVMGGVRRATASEATAYCDDEDPTAGFLYEIARDRSH